MQLLACGSRTPGKCKVTTVGRHATTRCSIYLPTLFCLLQEKFVKEAKKAEKAQSKSGAKDVAGGTAQKAATGYESVVHLGIGLKTLIVLAGFIPPCAFHTCPTSCSYDRTTTCACHNTPMLRYNLRVCAGQSLPQSQRWLKTATTEDSTAVTFVHSAGLKRRTEPGYSKSHVR
eukprot:697795-Pyramimonas_sp.AAC.1